MMIVILGTPLVQLVELPVGGPQIVEEDCWPPPWSGLGVPVGFGNRTAVRAAGTGVDTLTGGMVVDDHSTVRLVADDRTCNMVGRHELPHYHGCSSSPFLRGGIEGVVVAVDIRAALGLDGGCDVGVMVPVAALTESPCHPFA